MWKIKFIYHGIYIDFVTERLNFEMEGPIFLASNAHVSGGAAWKKGEKLKDVKTVA